MKHTPGPWSFDREIFWVNTPGQQERHGGLLVYPERNEDLTIAEVNDLFDKEKGRANAHLIAAAPELLEVLDWLLHLAHGCSKGGQDCPVTDEEWTDAWGEAKAAIAKTKGEAE